MSEQPRIPESKHFKGVVGSIEEDHKHEPTLYRLLIKRYDINIGDSTEQIYSAWIPLEEIFADVRDEGAIKWAEQLSDFITPKTDVRFYVHVKKGVTTAVEINPTWLMADSIKHGIELNNS